MPDQWTKRKEEKGPISNYTETHPSYGMIGISRVSGKGHLFGSEVQHLHYITLTIHEAQRVVNEPREFLSAQRELIRIAMTDAQFAQMITSPNQGDGVACTIDRRLGDKGEPWVNQWGGRPSPPAPEPYTKKYKDAMGDRADRVSFSIKQAQVLSDQLMNGEIKPSKSNLKELKDALYMAAMNLDQNMPYVLEELSEGIEKRMATAKSEFEAYVAHSLQAKGLQHLASQAPRLVIGTEEIKALPEETGENHG